MFVGGPPACSAGPGQRSRRRGNRPSRLLSISGMGRDARPGRSQRKVLLVLRRAVPRHNLQHHPPAEDPLLHGQPYYSMRRHLLHVCPRLLFAVRLRGEGQLCSFRHILYRYS